MQHLRLCLLLLRVAASSLLLFGRENNCSFDVVGVSPHEGRFYIDSGKLIIETCSFNLEVHHYGPGALHSQLDGVREGSLVFANPTSSDYRFDPSLTTSKVVEYWRYLFNSGEVAFGDMAKKIEELDANVRVYLVARPGTDATKYRFEKRPLEYPDLSGLGHLLCDYDLVDVALEDPSLDWSDFILRAHPDLVDTWTSTLDRALKLLGIVIWGVIARKASGDRALEALRRLSGCFSAAGRVLLAHERGASVQEAIRTIVRSAHPLLEAVRVGKDPNKASYLRALAMEVLYYVEKALPGRAEMAHDVVGLQRRVKKRCDTIDWAKLKFPGSNVLKRIVDRLQRDPGYRDDVWTMFVCLKYSALVPGMRESLMKESMEVCQKHQLQEAVPMLFMLSFGRWDWEKSGGFYRQLKSCQSAEAMFQTVPMLVIRSFTRWLYGEPGGHCRQPRPCQSTEAMFQAIAGFVAESREHECQRQNYWKLCCERVPSPAPHFADLVSHALSCGRVFERPYCQCSACVYQWSMSKDVLFRCVGEGLLRPMSLACDFRRVLSHLSHRSLDAERIGMRTCIDSMRPSWYSQCTPDDAVAEFVCRNGPPLVRRTLATWVHEMKLGDRAVPELPNRIELVELVKEVPEESRLFLGYRTLRFGENGIGTAEVAARWMSANPDYTVLSRSSVSRTVCVLEDGLVAMSDYALEDPNTVDSLMGYVGPRTVEQLSRILNSRHSHISVQADRQSGRIRVCKVVGDEDDNDLWIQSMVLRWTPGRGVSVFPFSRNQEQTVYFSVDSAVPELFCIFNCPFHSDPDAELVRYRGESGGTVGTGTARFVSDVVPIVDENEDLDSLVSPTGVEVRLTGANKTNPVVRALSECLKGVPYVLQDVQTWEHMEWMVRELRRHLIAAFRVFGGQQVSVRGSDAQDD